MNYSRALAGTAKRKFLSLLGVELQFCLLSG